MSEYSFKQYQREARRTQNPDLSPRDMQEHALWGLASEVGEVCSLHQKTHQGHSLDPAALRKEIGDCLWMISELCDLYGFDLSVIAQMNIAKLRKRYPYGFSAEKSINRVE